MHDLLKGISVAVALAASACAGAAGIGAPDRNAALPEGPPISDIVTPFDEALQCLDGHIQDSVTFSVGAIVDQTGKEQFTEGGAGKFITQGAGDIVQSALFRAGATVLNRRDPRIMETEVQWGIRDPRRIVPSNLYITGSINSLDFIPGGGAETQVAGIGPRYRQYRMLVGLDLALTDANTGRIVANVPLQKQIFASEAGVGVGRFFGDTLVSLDLGGQEREALHFALRQMLNLATFDLLTQVMDPKNYEECRAAIDRAHGFVDHTRTAAALERLNGTRVAEAAKAAAAARAAAEEGPEGEADGNSYWRAGADPDEEAQRRRMMTE